MMPPHRTLARALLAPVTLLPRRSVSRATGWLARRHIPHPLRAPLLRGLGWLLGVPRKELGAPLDAHATIGAWFARRLPAGSRPVAAGADLVWPCDGRVTATGTVGDLDRVHLKGIPVATGRLFDGVGPGTPFCVVHLAPGGYHRIHAPAPSCRVVAVDAASGDRWPVHRRALAARPTILEENVRTTVDLEAPRGPVRIVLVGAFNVGSIQLACAPGDRLASGDEVAWFDLGSCVVLAAPGLMPPPPGTRVTCGDSACAG